MKARRLTVVFLAVLLLSSQGRSSFADTKQDEAWSILHTNINEKSTAKRAQAISVLGLLPGNAEALKIALKSTEDEKAEVRAAGASALGQMRSKAALPKLETLLMDAEPTVALAAATALMEYKDNAAYEVYYEFLTGERKTGAGMIASQMKTLKDPKKMAELGIEEGIGFIPFAGIGLAAFKTLRVDDASPVRAAAAKRLANDPDPASGEALVAAISDKSWIVRAAALEAIAKRGDAKLLEGIMPAMLDTNTSVRCTAAAAVIRLSTVSSARPAKKLLTPAAATAK